MQHILLVRTMHPHHRHQGTKRVGHVHLGALGVGTNYRVIRGTSSDSLGLQYLKILLDDINFGPLSRCSACCNIILHFQYLLILKDNKVVGLGNR